MPRADKAGFPTYWTSFGQGPRDALMIHCSLAHSGAWGGLARHLSGALTMTAFDMPGHGRSANWDNRGEIQQTTAAIAAAFCHDGPRDVIGHSFGATVALRLAVTRPDLVRSLVLIEPVFFAVARQDCPDIYEAHCDQTARFETAMREGDTSTAAREFIGLWGGEQPWEVIPEAHRRELANQMSLIAAAAASLYDDTGGMLKDGVLQGLDVPALLIEGSGSPRVISVVQEGLSARLPLATRTVIAGAGHMAPITHAQQVAGEILRFLGQVPG